MKTGGIQWSVDIGQRDGSVAIMLQVLKSAAFIC
jgi:hypothetical protein